MSNNNFLNYSGLTYESIIEAINTKITSDPRFANFSDSQISAMILQIFAATTDFLSFLMESCFNENFFQTAQLRSSVINLSRNLGYVVTRPIPATAKMKVKLFGDFSGYGFTAGTTIQVPYHSNFSYGDSTYILKDSLYILLTQSMITDMTSLGSNYSQIVSTDYKGADIVLIEGSIKEKIITGSNNPLVAALFQSYKISDTTFSNHYGDTDFTNELTKVYCGVGKDRKYTIDKRSVINWNNFTTATLSAGNPICVIRTGSDEGVELLFGDGIYADIGAKTTAENVWISYLSTKGSKGNATGLIGEALTFSGKVYSSTTADLTGKVEFQFEKNPSGGADLESIDSIKMNAPAIYYSLDRLVSVNDYINYLKTLTSPIAIKNALAWGEQFEIQKHTPMETSDIKMFNIAFFTCLGSLYNLVTSPYSPRETNNNLNLAVLDNNYDEDEVPIRGYFNIYMKQDQINQFLEYSASTSFWNYQGIATSATSATNMVGAVNLATTYGSTAPLYVQYFSSSTETSIIGTSAFNIDVSNMGAFSSGTVGLTSAMDSIAAKITTALQGTVDMRGLVATNTSRGQTALPTIQCYYTPSTYTFATSASSNDPCYLYSITGNFANDIGLSARPPSQYLQTETDFISENIVTVRDLIQDRAQITVNSVYLTPVIHTFALSGSVYVNPLYDLITVKTEIEDALYTFFDANSDFNAPIYLSNVIDSIKSNNGVKFCDVGFKVTYPTRADGQSYHSVEIAKPIYTYWNSLYPTIPYLFGTKTLTQYLDIYNTLISAYASYVIFTERYLLDLLKSYYDTLVIQAPLYAASNDFLNWCTAIRKDYVRYIRGNLINTYGNIGEGILQSDNTTTYYGFSVGSEIAKVKCQMNYSYKG